MSVQGQRGYNRKFMMAKRALERVQRLMKEGKCILCEVVLKEAPEHDCRAPIKWLKEE